MTGRYICPECRGTGIDAFMTMGYEDGPQPCMNCNGTGTTEKNEWAPEDDPAACTHVCAMKHPHAGHHECRLCGARY